MSLKCNQIDLSINLNPCIEACELLKLKASEKNAGNYQQKLN